ncbi:Gfo/Idh/MocA family oxidoreductase [Robbsia sp. KACC 23696]|uniref:Gfo/Idh/MocA family oxidoreductase n=1 Tax=Robbsia sp. KACC 23696 TaxID=3149231 RepID=UPI00325BC224
MGIAVVGLGRLSLDAILPGLAGSKLCRLAAVMTGDKEKGQRIAAQYGAPRESVYGYDEWDRLGNDKGIDVVYLVTPNGMHCEQVKQAARIGKHVLCQKPMSNTAAEAEAMIAACADAGVLLMVAYRLQYEPHNRHAAQLVRAKTFGELKLIEAHNGQVQDKVPQWRDNLALSGGGALPDIGLYSLNFARFVTGEEPCEVMAWAWSTPGDERFTEVEENIAWQMRFPSGVVAKLSAAYDAHEARTATLHCQTARVNLDPAFPYHGIRLHVSHRSPDDPASEVEEERVIAEIDQFATEMDHMAECVLTGCAVRTPGEEGLQDQRIMEAIYQSARENRPISLPVITTKDAFRAPFAPDGGSRG